MHILAFLVTLCLLRLALWGYSVASLHPASCFALAFSVIRFTTSDFMLHTRILSHLVPSGFALAFLVATFSRALSFAFVFSVASFPRALRFTLSSCLLCAHINFLKKKMCLNQIERTHRNKKKKKTFGLIRALHKGQSASGEAQLYLPDVTPRVPRGVHAKFHADWSKTVGVRGIHTDTQTDSPSFII